MTFGERLASLRTQKDLSQTELAKRLNISKSALAMYETNNRQPNFEITKKLADYFQVSVDFLLGRTDKPDEQADQKQLNKQSEINTAFYDFDNLTEEEKEYLETQLEIFRKIKEGSKLNKDK